MKMRTHFIRTKTIFGNLLYCIALAAALNLGGCSNSGNNETENPGQGVIQDERSGNTDTGARQQDSEPNVNTENTGTPAEENQSPGTTHSTPDGGGETGIKVQTSSNPETKPPKEEVKKDNKDDKTTADPDKDAGSGTGTDTGGNGTGTDTKTDTGTGNGTGTEVKTETGTGTGTHSDTPVEEPREEVAVVVTQPSGDDWNVPDKAKSRANPVKADGESVGIGKSLFLKHCASCHGKKGLGDGSKAAQLDTPVGNFSLATFQKQTDGTLFYKTSEGKGDMPEFKKKITDEEDIWHIINYIRTLKK